MAENHGKILLTGCGRCGSKYLSVVMRAAGFHVLHEQMGRDGIVSWHMAVDADAVPLGPASREYRFDHVFHFVRHPLTAIPSIAAADLSDESWEFIRKYVPYRSDEPAVLKSARYWYHWNCAAQSKALASRLSF